MSNHIFDINDNFNYDLINLGNPTIINNNAYFSKISHGDLQKNLYLQFPKCNTKLGIVKTNNKMICELNYFMANKKIIEFFENLEKIIVDKVYNNKELWFYEADTIEKNDIEELMTPIIKPHKHGKNFLVKTYVNQDKFNIYDENEIKVELNNLTSNSEFIPLININGIKFTSKSFLIELILAQAMVILPAEEFEKNILIKCNNNSIINNESSKSENISSSEKQTPQEASQEVSHEETQQQESQEAQQQAQQEESHETQQQAEQEASREESQEKEILEESSNKISQDEVLVDEVSDNEVSDDEV